MKIIDLELMGVKLIEPTIFKDERGDSTEAYTTNLLKEAGFSNSFVVDYEAYNEKKHTLRGIHFQLAPRLQSKLVRVLHGSIYDVVVDLRKDSPTYKRWIGVRLTADNYQSILIPPGFGHAYLTLEDKTSVLYKFDDYFVGTLTKTIRWNDEELGIMWDVENPILSDKDSTAPSLSECEFEFIMEDSLCK